MMAISFVLAACGGGGGKSDAPAPQTPQTVYYQLAAGELDGDALVDLAAVVRIHDSSAGTADRAELRVLAQRADSPGRFTVIQHLSLSSYQGALSAAELDGDGRTDLVVTDEVGGSVRVYLQDASADGQFSLHQTLAAPGPASVEVADVDLDGAPDLILATPRGVLVLRQDSDARGSFPENLRVVVDASLDPGDALSPDFDSLAVGDLNHDGLVDVVTVRADTRVRIYYHDDAVPGSFLPAVAIGMNLTVAATVALADLDQDGYDDIVVAGGAGGPVFIQPSLRVRRQDPTAPGVLMPVFRFNLTDQGEPERLALVDVTGDDRPDIVVAKLYTVEHGFVEVLEQTAPVFGLRRLGTFAPLTLPGVDPHLRGLALADLNDDGLADVAVSDGQLSVLFNEPASPGQLHSAVAVESP